MATDTLYLLLRFGFLALLWLLICLCVLVVRTDLRPELAKARGLQKTAKSVASGVGSSSLTARRTHQQRANTYHASVNSGAGVNSGAAGAGFDAVIGLGEAAGTRAAANGAGARLNSGRISARLAGKLSGKVMPPPQSQYAQDPSGGSHNLLNISDNRGSREASASQLASSSLSSPLNTARVSRVLIVDGPQKGKVIPLATAGITFGRSQDCDFQLQDNFASGKHLRIFLQNGCWYAQDLHSTNGSFVNGDRIEVSAPLEMGTQIRIGQTTMELS